MKKHIPNIITLCNLLCGCVAVIYAAKGDVYVAGGWVLLGIFFDFFDGFFARLLKVKSEIGLQLDSLADMVTSGVVPGIAMYQMLQLSDMMEGANTWLVYLPYVGFFITLASAYRLANFNIDTRQTTGFIGLPTPANTLFIISLAVIKSLMKHPYVNASLSSDEKEMYLHHYVNLSIAVGMDSGLVVPVIKGADKMSLKELVVASKEITTKALAGKLKPDEMADSTFTISNLGMYGVKSFVPIINQPNTAILGVSATVQKPVVLNGEVKVRPIMTLTLTADHRVVDGLEGAKFMKTLKEAIENPLSLLI